MKCKYFDLNDIRRDRLKARILSIKHDRIQELRLRNVKQLCGRLPHNGESFFIETTKSFNAFTFIVYLIKTAGYVDDLYIATYSINKRIISSLLRWKEAGKIGTIHIHISETIKFRTPDDFKRLLELKQQGLISISTGWTHKKVSCMKTPIGYYVVEGSGNYGENAMEEQYVFTQSKQIYEFRKSKSNY